MTEPALDALDAALRDAHERADLDALQQLYATAAKLHEDAGNEAAAAFFLTQAYVFALDCGHPDATEYAAELRSMGRL